MKLTENVLLVIVESEPSLINFLNKVALLDEFRKDMLLSDVILPLMHKADFAERFSALLLRHLYWLPLRFHELHDAGRIFLHEAFMPFVRETMQRDYGEQIVDKFESALIYQSEPDDNYALSTYLADLWMFYTCMDIPAFIEYSRKIPLEIFNDVLNELYTAGDFEDFIAELSQNLYQFPALLLALDEPRKAMLLDYLVHEPAVHTILLQNYDNAKSIADYFELTDPAVLPVAYTLLSSILRQKIFYPNDFTVISKVLPAHYQSALYAGFSENLQNWVRNDDELCALLSVLTIDDFESHLNNHAHTLGHYFNTAERYEKLLRVLPEEKKSMIAARLMNSIAEVINSKHDLLRIMKLLSEADGVDLCARIGAEDLIWKLRWFDNGRETCLKLAPEKAAILFEYLHPLFTVSPTALKSFPTFAQGQSISHLQLYALKIREHVATCMPSFDDFMGLITNRHLHIQSKQVLNEVLGDAVYHLIRNEEDFARALLQAPIAVNNDMVRMRAATVSIQVLSELLSRSTSQWYRMTHRDRSKEGVFADISRVASMHYLMRESQVKEMLLTLYTTANHARGLGQYPQSARVMNNYLASEAGECLRALIVPIVPDIARQLRPAIASISP